MSTKLPNKLLRIALLQNDAGLDMVSNNNWTQSHLPPAGSVDLIVLTEMFALRGGDSDYRAMAEPLNGLTCEWLATEARKRKTWILAGSLVEKKGQNFYNTAVLFDRKGTIAAVYRKMHLFDAKFENANTICESDLFTAGKEKVLVDIDGWCCGLSICYDIRFPELYRYYSKHGAHLILVPANFTYLTGKDHWRTLIMARAIENQCFVVAANQCGINPVSQVKSYGHSLVVSPWGKELAKGDNRPAVIKAVLDPQLLREARERVPALNHRRLA